MGKKLMVLNPVLVDFMPDTLEDGVLYISQKFSVAIHRCPCGCGEQVVTPLNVGNGWEIDIDNGRVSLTPSIGNWSFPCRSHYFIRENKIVWCK